jgi:hypothetical protein
MLDNSFQTFTCSVQRRTGMCLIGINLKRKEALLISEAIVTTETFLLNTNLQLKEMVLNYRKSLLLMRDYFLTRYVVKSADAQLRNGVITSSEYLVELIYTNQKRIKNYMKFNCFWRKQITTL